MENENEIIDFIINKLSLIEPRKIKLSEIKERFEVFELKDFNDLIPRLEIEYGLIDRINYKGQVTYKMARLTKFGNSVAKSGGWIKHLKEKENSIEPISKPTRKSSLKRFFSNPYVIGFVMLLVEEIVFGLIRKANR